MRDPWDEWAKEAGLPWTNPPKDLLNLFDWCNALADYIKNLQKSMNRRKDDLERNPLNLPWDSCREIRDDQKGHLRQLLLEELLIRWAQYQFEKICRNNNMVGLPNSPW